MKNDQKTCKIAHFELKTAKNSHFLTMWTMQTQVSGAKIASRPYSKVYFMFTKLTDIKKVKKQAQKHEKQVILSVHACKYAVLRVF